jgi:hypothetical protein
LFGLTNFGDNKGKQLRPIETKHQGRG